YYNVPVDPNNFELNYEDLRNHYSTQIAFSTDIWREAFMFDSLQSPDARVFRIPGAVISDATAYVVGRPHTTANVSIYALDCQFGDGRRVASVRLDENGVARLSLRSAIET